ncbi:MULTISPECIES: head GIN domain-containing protein [unclassified Flavobacterium]|uniref:head GIN domain-containing protein n=1 Tax=unclassified Flavobacterium TaxID=196869 RepID=UPI003F8ED04D
MLKIITIITKWILVSLLALFFTSCNYSVNLKSITGSGNVTTENRPINENFKSIEVSNAIDVVVEQADKFEVTVEADDNLQENITTKVENGVLIIACDYNSFIDINSKKVTVKMPIIEELQASSASTITNINTIKGESVDLRTSSAANIDLHLEAEKVICKTSSGSSINVDGLALHLETTASSGSVIDAKDLQVNEATARSSSGASIQVNPIVSLKARASSGSSITYTKTPKSIEKNSSSGGSIGLN